MNNELLAKVIFTNKLATKEQIHAHWSEVTVEKDIAQVLIQHEILPEKYYQQLVNYVNKLAEDPKYSASTPESSQQDVPETPEPSKEEITEESSPENEDVKVEEQSPTNTVSLTQTSIHEASESTSISTKEIPQISNPMPLSQHEEIETVGDLANNDIFYGSYKSAAEEVAPSDALVQTSFTDELTKKVFQSTVSEDSSPQPTVNSNKIQVIPETIPHTGPSLPIKFHGQRGRGAAEFNIIDNVDGPVTLFQLLEYARRQGASDLHLVANNPITIRKYSSLIAQSQEVISQERLEEIIYASVPQDDLKEFLETGDFETVITIPSAGRYRVTYMRQRAGWDFSARVIADGIIPFAELGLPKAAEGLTKWAQGLVLVTGPVGCGKTTTLATLVQMVNDTRKDHIITVESPVELVYPESQCQMTQREVGMHTLSPANALKGALRQDPDILVVSELRDLETIELAVSAAETGHLVFGTMNTNNAARTITRIVDSFPPDEQEIIRSMISESLRGVICQQLLPLKDGSGVVPAFEVLLMTPPVSNLIRKNEIHQLESAMITGRSQGMVLLDDSLQKLIDEGLVNGKDCYYRANNPKNFEKYLKEGDK